MAPHQVAAFSARTVAPRTRAVPLGLLLAVCGLAAVGLAPVRGTAAPTPPAASARGAEWCNEAHGFGAAVLITPDPDWKTKWGSPAGAVPRVERTNALHVGEKVWALIYVTSPFPNAAGVADVTCDLRMIRPNGKISEFRDVRALGRKLEGPVEQTYLSEFVLTMTGAENDPLGEWVVEITVHDRNRGLEVPVVGRYTLLPKAARASAAGGSGRAH